MVKRRSISKTTSSNPSRDSSSKKPKTSEEKSVSSNKKEKESEVENMQDVEPAPQASSSSSSSSSSASNNRKKAKKQQGEPQEDLDSERSDVDMTGDDEESSDSGSEIEGVTKNPAPGPPSAANLAAALRILKRSNRQTLQWGDEVFREMAPLKLLIEETESRHKYIAETRQIERSQGMSQKQLEGFMRRKNFVKVPKVRTSDFTNADGMEFQQKDAPPPEPSKWLVLSDDQKKRYFDVLRDQPETLKQLVMMRSAGLLSRDENAFLYEIGVFVGEKLSHFPDFSNFDEKTQQQFDDLAEETNYDQANGISPGYADYPSNFKYGWLQTKEQEREEGIESKGNDKETQLAGFLRYKRARTFMDVPEHSPVVSPPNATAKDLKDAQTAEIEAVMKLDVDTSTIFLSPQEVRARVRQYLDESQYSKAALFRALKTNNNSFNSFMNKTGFTGNNLLVYPKLYFYLEALNEWKGVTKSLERRVRENVHCNILRYNEKWGYDSKSIYAYNEAILDQFASAQAIIQKPDQRPPVLHPNPMDSDQAETHRVQCVNGLAELGFYGTDSN